MENTTNNTTKSLSCNCPSPLSGMWNPKAHVRLGEKTLVCLSCIRAKTAAEAAVEDLNPIQLEFLRVVRFEASIQAHAARLYGPRVDWQALADELLASGPPELLEDK